MDEYAQECIPRIRQFGWREAPAAHKCVFFFHGNDFRDAKHTLNVSTSGVSWCEECHQVLLDNYLW